MLNNQKKKLSVLIVANCTWYLYNFREELIKDLKGKNYELILTAPFDKYQKRISKYFCNSENLFLVRGSENPLIEIISLIHLLFIFIKYKPDLVHNFTIKPCIYGSIISQILGIKNTINHITGLGPSFYSSRLKIKLINLILMPLYKYAFYNKKNKIINIFHNDSDRYTFIKKRISEDKNTITIGGSGVNIDDFKNNSIKYERKGVKQLLFPARIIKEKGIVELINACNELWDENHKFILNIAGEIDKQNKSHLRTNALEFLIKNKNIRFLGKCKNMVQVYKKMDIVILPSWREGLSKSLLESASMSLGIITTDVPGCNDIIKNKHSGLLVPLKSKGHLKSAIKQYLESPKLVEMYGKNARKTVKENFTTRKINSKILKVYDQLLKEIK